MENTEDKVKQIVNFWLGFDFLKKFKELGEKYSKQIKQEQTVKTKEK